MTWPQATDYNAAVQNPQLSFRDDDLRQGQVAGDMFGLPRPHSGNFADVYQIQGANNQSWAVKCFTRPVAGLHQRYQAISDHLHQTQRAFMVEFRYLEEGICIHGQWYPLVKMRWVEGFTLNEFIRQHLDKPVLLDRLAQMWVRLAQELRDARMAHGDLQHGNVLLVPGSKSSSLALKLIDYDGMFVPALAEVPSGEVGHPNYQHPQRLREGAYDREVDRFSHLLIYTALRCVQVGGAELWERHDSLENLLFREEDFRRPQKSRLLRELWELPDGEARDLVGHLLIASQGPLLVVPSLDELLEDRTVRPLTGSEEAQVNALLGETKVPSSGSRVRVPVQSAPAIEVPAAPVAVLAAAPPKSLHETVLDVGPPQPTTPELPRVATPPPLPRQAPLGPPDTTIQSAASNRLDAATFLDPVVSVLSRPGWMAAVGGIALVSFLLVNVLVWYFLRQPPPNPLPSARPARLSYIDDVLLKGGQKCSIPLRVDRNDCQEPLRFQVDGLPAEMRPTMPTLDRDQASASLPLAAPLDFELPARDVVVSLWQGEKRIDEQPFRLSVRKVPSPRLLKDKLESIHCKTGQTLVYRAEVDRQGCTEPLTLQFDNLPAGVTQQSTSGPAVELKVLRGAEPAKLHAVRLRLNVGETMADSAPLFFNIDKVVPIVRLKRGSPPETVSLEAGKSADLPVAVERKDHDGPIEVRLEGLPLGVTATWNNLAAGVSSTSVALKTAAGIEASRGPVKVAIVLEGATLDERTVTLSVEKPAADTKPDSVMPEKPDGKHERVTFMSVDHVHLVGTLYPGSRGKKGACVLLLHDLDSNRSTPAWRRLAEAIQQEGHTVFTFDFRGCGESTGVDLRFWDQSVNRQLPLYDREKLPGAQAVKIAAGELPGSYMPWLVHDIAAARMFLDLRHDDPDSPVNTFNLVVIGAGQASALGSLWLASEGVRYEPVREALNVQPPPSTKRSVLLAVWIGLDQTLNGQAFPVYNWVLWAHQAPSVPVVFVFGAADVDTARLLRPVLVKGLGEAEIIPGAQLPGRRLLSKDRDAEKRIHDYLRKALGALKPQKWAARHIKDLRSYWRFPLRPPLFFQAKERGDTILQPLPLRDRFEIQMPGLGLRPRMVPGPFDK